MVHPLELIPKYELIAQFSDKMRQAAELQDWPLFGALEKDCKLAIMDLRACLGNGDFPDEIMPVRQRVLRQVLADDASIRGLIQPELKHALQWLSYPLQPPPDSG
jgi:hypothetical protein